METQAEGSENQMELPFRPALAAHTPSIRERFAWGAMPPQPLGAEDVGRACFDLAVGFDSSYSRLIEQLRQSDRALENLDFSAVWTELLCLGFFAVQHALTVSLHTEKLHGVLQAYHGQLKLLRMSGVFDFFEIVTSRSLVYSAALDLPSAALSGRIGEIFAGLAGRRNHSQLIGIGASLFEHIDADVRRWIAEIGEANIVI
ncbi:MAG: hypothetical protein JO317_09360 [Verrucomicrobiae bacterium]|nr:hypothetical protein [Verrucomicrobiae bacterium]